ncbi:MAG: Cj0069 family protein, partial [Bdellovibrionota bacterium]
MENTKAKRVAILYPGNLEARRSATPGSGRLPTVFAAFEALGIRAEPAVYHDDFRDEVKQQLQQVNAVLAWVNPIEEGRDRSQLDSLLREIAASGIYVSTHPDVILKLGTKEVLVRTKELGWGSDTHLYSSLDQLRRELPARLEQGEIRVLKQFRGHSGHGVWQVERASTSGGVNGKTLVRARHAKSGCFEEVITLDDFFERCTPYFSALDGQGCMIDQVYQPRLPEGMVRCYLVGGKVEGFGRQEIVALHPAPAG